MKKDRLVFWSLCGIFVVSLLFQIFYFVHAGSKQMSTVAWMDSREGLLYNLNRLSSFWNVCIQVAFIFAIVRMFRTVFPVGMVGRQWCRGLVFLFVSSMVIPAFLGLSWLDVIPVSWSYILSNLNVAVKWGGVVLLVLLFFRLFKCKKILYGRLFVISILLLLITIGAPWLESYVVFSLERWGGRLFWDDVIMAGERSSIALIELLFIGEVNRLQDFFGARQMKDNRTN